MSTDGRTPATATDAAARAFIPVRVLIAAGAAVVLDLIVLWIASAGGASLIVTPPGAPGSIQVDAVAVTLTVVVPMVVVGAGVWLLTRRWPAIRLWAAWAGLAFGVLSAALPLTVEADLGTKLALASMHVITGVAWFVALVRGPRPSRDS
ncbi:DUF6069 family protein [Agromyces sp. NPDC058484]|uniref:DUF6069 family protein n=1 Tax=Agromyces sp. NPDC058484 TaxID=3346524 RepID=UPI003650CF58